MTSVNDVISQEFEHSPERLKYNEQKDFYFNLLDITSTNVIRESILFKVYPLNIDNLTLFLDNKEFEKLLLLWKYIRIPIPHIIQYFQKMGTEFVSKLIKKYENLEPEPEIIITDEYSYKDIDPDSYSHNFFCQFVKILDDYKNKEFPVKIVKKLKLFHKIFKEGAFKSDPESMCYLGYFFLHPINNKISEKMNYFNYDTIAFKLFKLSFDMKFMFAGTHLAPMYLDGIGTTPNIDLAIEIFEKTERLGCIISTFNLGRIYLYGMKVEKNYEKAYFYLHKAHLANNHCASTELGVMFKNGYHVEANIGYALKLFSCAILNDNNAMAYYELGLIHLYEKKYFNPQKAVKLIKCASEQFHTDAMCKMAEFYYHGIQLDLDIVKSISLLKKAYELGNENANTLYKKYMVEINKYM